eukprot:1318791-Amphidinium_carterae.1
MRECDYRASACKEISGDETARYGSRDPQATTRQLHYLRATGTSINEFAADGLQGVRRKRYDPDEAGLRASCDVPHE